MLKVKNRNSTREGDLRGCRYSAVLALAIPLLMFCTTFALADQAKHKQSGSTWTFNFESTPLRINATGDRSYSLTNESEGKIARYRIGCVQVDGKDHSSVVHREETEVVEIAPHALWGVDAFHNLAVRTACEEKESRVAVVEVYFEDGGQWQVPVNVP